MQELGWSAAASPGSKANTRRHHRHHGLTPQPALAHIHACVRLLFTSPQEVLNEFPDVRLAYGESDEYSFVLGRSTDMYGRRASKIVSLLVSCFTANYVAKWAAFLPDTPLRSTPMFDGRAVCYPLDSNLRVSGA